MNARITRPALMLCTLLIVAAFPAAAQQEEAAVEAAVQRLFEAMREADGAAATVLFRADARLQSVTEQNGEPRLLTSEVGAFLQAVGTPRTEVWDERIWNLRIEVSGDLASAWMNYAFYLDDRFSHCGVNAFHLVRTDGEWKILQLTDTRRRSGCELPV